MIGLRAITARVIARFEAMSVEEFADRLRKKGHKVTITMNTDYNDIEASAKQLSEQADALYGLARRLRRGISTPLPSVAVEIEGIAELAFRAGFSQGYDSPLNEDDAWKAYRGGRAQ